jgi:Domain of Unknown Function (DUF1080)
MRRAVYALCLLYAATGIGYAQGDKAKPNTLTPKEIADGWILLFDGETTFGWTELVRKPPNKFEVENGALIVPCGSTILHDRDYGDHELAFEYKSNGEGSRYGVLNNGRHLLKLPATNKQWKLENLRKTNETDFTVSVRDRETVLLLRNIKLHPLNMQPIFNGKDLTGWKEFPGKKSKFTVENGEIHLTNGPGDLQTVGKFKDFILQLECKSNGRHLNSGIFFRCKDGEYQNGYEAQILNKFSKDATQKYQVEDYDPKTKKLIGTKEVMSPAFDYGTGAIYRRVPARKEMAMDGEWFAMTIVAHGNHIATWVNGVQVVDWTDNRPKSDNPRNGCRLEAGHISIQGHDPTTDLSFRNIRIAEFK